MSQRERVSIIGLGVIIGLVFGLVYKVMMPCLITGIVVASTIMVMLSQKSKNVKN